MLLYYHGEDVQRPAAGEDNIEERRNAPAVLETALRKQTLVFRGEAQ